MISYSIDASVYAFPFQQLPSDPNEIYNYCETINGLYDLVEKKQPRNKKLFLFLKDMKFIVKHEELNFIIQDITPLDQLLEENNIEVNILREAQEALDSLFDRLYINQGEYDRLPEKILFEEWFNIENVIFKSNKIPNDVDKVIKNKDLKKNVVKNIAKIAFLNKYVYKGDKIHNLVLGADISAKSIQITTDTEFDITMTNGSYSNGNTYNNVIKDAPLQNINIKGESVSIFSLDTLVKGEHKNRTREWEEALNDAENDFKHLVFCEVKTSLLQYINKIKGEYCRLDPYSQKQVDEWMEEGPNTLYEYLKALNNLVSTVDLYPFVKNMGERYHCNNTCEFYESCGSNLRFFGVDCVYESKKNIEDRDGLDPFDLTKIDRTIKNSENGYSIYWTHLRPKTFKCDDLLWFLTLRIHFRLLEPYTAQKAEIGWIGRHLYHPCGEDKYGSKKYECCKRHECPLYPLNPLNPPYDPKADVLTNYLKQWPELELKNEPPKADKPEKS